MRINATVFSLRIQITGKHTFFSCPLCAIGCSSVWHPVSQTHDCQAITRSNSIDEIVFTNLQNDVLMTGAVVLVGL